MWYVSAWDEVSRYLGGWRIIAAEIIAVDIIAVEIIVVESIGVEIIVVEIIVEIILVDTRVPGVPGVPVVEIIVEILLCGCRGNFRQRQPATGDPGDQGYFY